MLRAIRIAPRSLLTAPGPTTAGGWRRLHVYARRRERPRLELPPLRRLHVLVVVTATQRDPSRITVFADVDDDGVLAADRAAGCRLDDVIGDEVADIIRAARLRIREGHEILASLGARAAEHCSRRKQTRVGGAVVGVAIETVGIVRDELLDVDVVLGC